MKEGEMKEFRCGVCNFTYEGDDAPDKCARCGSPKEKFQQIPEDKAKLIDRSRLSNGLHILRSPFLRSRYPKDLILSHSQHLNSSGRNDIC